MRPEAERKSRSTSAGPPDDNPPHPLASSAILLPQGGIMNRALCFALFASVLGLTPHGCSCFVTCRESPAPLSGPMSAPPRSEAVARTEKEQKYAVRMFLLEPVYFTVGKYSITPRAAKVLQKESEWLRKNPDTKISISGNADSRAGKKYNRILAQKRAEAVKNRLVALGINPDRIQTTSYGKSNPVCTKTTRNCYAANRRVDLQAIGRMPIG